MTTEPRLPHLSAVLIHLLKSGVLYRDQQPVVWDDLLRLQAKVWDHMQLIGLDLHIDETEGFAYLKQKPSETDQEALPRLIHRRALSYPVSLLCVLLRKKLLETDAGGEQNRAILTRDQIADMMRLFLPDRPNETLTDEQIDATIRKVEDYGFLRDMKNDTRTYEIRRIIKVLVDADWLASLDEKLTAYRDHGNAPS